MCVVWLLGLGMGYVCGIAFEAWDGVCVWYSFWGLGWDMCVIWLVGLGYVCGIACEAWDRVCVWYGLWGFGWCMCVV